MSSPLQSYFEQGYLAGQRFVLGIPRNAAMGMTGATLSSLAGSSLEFRDHRQYEPGDDLRHIDWQAYARTDSLIVKIYREEITPHLDLIIDGSQSMAVEGTQKEGAAAALLALFAAAGARAGYSQAGWRLSDRCRKIPGGNRPPSEWEALEFTHKGGPDGPLSAFKPRGTRILIGDLLWETEPLTVLRGLAERSALCLVVQLLSRADVTPPLGKALRLIDSETGAIREIQIDTLAAKRYLDALARHQQAWSDACRQCGAQFIVVVAEDLLEEWNLDELVVAGILRTRSGGAVGAPTGNH